MRWFPLLVLLVGCGKKIGDGTPPDETVEVECIHVRWQAGNGDNAAVSGSSYGSTWVEPIPTHYPQPYDGEAAELRGNIRWNIYSNSNNDPTAVDSDAVTDFVTTLEQASGRGVALLNDPSQLQKDFDLTQVLVNLRFDVSMATIVLPPRWNGEEDLPLPVLVSGNPGTQSNNERLFYGGDYGARYAALAAASAASSNGMITVIHNMGGRESLGNTTEIMEDVGCMLEYVEAAFNGDRNRVVFAGASRGGTAALIWGANPLGIEYEAAGIFAHAPLWNHADILGTPFNLAPETPWTTADVLGMQRAFYYQNDPGPADVVDAITEVWSPNGSLESLEEVVPAAWVSAMADVPAISVTVGTQDGSVPFSDGVAMLQDMEDGGLDFHAEIVIGGAHREGPTTEAFLDQQVDYLLGNGSAPDVSGRTFQQVPEIGAGSHGDFTEVSIGADLPWAVSFPVMMETDSPGEVQICGPGGDVSVLGAVAGEVLVDEALTVDEGCTAVAYTAPSSPADPIDWSLTVPGEGARSYSTTITSDTRDIADYYWDYEDGRSAGYAVLP